MGSELEAGEAVRGIYCIAPVAVPDVPARSGRAGRR